MKLNFRQKLLVSSLGLTLLLLALPFTIRLARTLQYRLSEAQGFNADIEVDAQVVLGPMETPWKALAQGGEEKTKMLSPVISEMRNIQPRYIRIDHIYDFYHVVAKDKTGKLIYTWDDLDQIVNDILDAGALPFFALSYMPATIAKDGQITNPPVDWHDWSRVVQETVQHYSGRKNRNLTNVIYEVWNEPDLFGNWQIGQGKNYNLLYKYAAIGADRAADTNPFKIGGPATTAPYRSWIDEFLDFTKENRLRIDFYSWHRYSLEPQDFLEDINRVDGWLFKNAGHGLEKYITEWGSISENSAYHDTFFDAAHLIATSRYLIQRVDLAFIFEIKDGPDPSGQKYWGRFGLLTHEQAGPIEKKPKYFALKLLNQMKGSRIRLEGEGSWVTGFAAKEDNQIRIMAVNFDPHERHHEQVPLSVNNLENGDYFYQTNFLLGAKNRSLETVTDHTLNKEISLSPNNAVLIELIKK